MILSSTGLIIISFVLTLVMHEMYSSSSQAQYFHEIARDLKFRVEPGPNADAYFPRYGPFDKRLGYVQLPHFIAALTQNGFRVTAQARMSARMRQLVDSGLFPIYKEKTQAGIEIHDRRGARLFSRKFPERGYMYFDSIPKLVVDTLLYIENRDLLSNEYPERNPAVEWDRLFKVSGDALLNALFARDKKRAGASTLATQLEKYRHSEHGITRNASEKFRQMMSATLRAYLDGEQTIESRRRVVRDYVNTVPLAARRHYGEVNGIGDGLWAWYGTEFWDADYLLSTDFEAGSRKEIDKARIYKQVLSLFLAQRRPSYYLANPRQLEQLTDFYLDLLARDGIISHRFKEVVQSVPLEFRSDASLAEQPSFVNQKAVNAIRTDLLRLLKVRQLYDLDRLDLSVTATIDNKIQGAVTEKLVSFGNLDSARAHGLIGHRLLKEDNDLKKVIYSLTLFEKTPKGNAVRIQADNYDQPLDINEGVKLDLGSTSKLRTLVSYLDLISNIYRKFRQLSPDERAAIPIPPKDHLSNWVRDYLADAPEATLYEILDAAMKRRYSADPNERFFTGGGLHTFSNFKRSDNYKSFTVAEALHESVNLVFIRMMRDIVNYFIYQNPIDAHKLLSDPSDPRRTDFLKRFAEFEGKKFIRKFYRKYSGLNEEELLEKLAKSIHPTPRRLAVVFNSLVPDASFAQFKAFAYRHLGNNGFPEHKLHMLFKKYTPENFDLSDRGTLARIHPLEIWTAQFLRNMPNASIRQTLAASIDERQNVYQWLHKTNRIQAQNIRIRQLLEVDAFKEIHKQWQRFGYPFGSLVPSLATSIGSSADRPSALTELMGIIVNNGKRLPTINIDKLTFAAGSPFEVHLERDRERGEQVIAPEVALVLRTALIGVVERGTARRAFRIFPRGEHFLRIGGKTGTGDHRYKVYDKYGHLKESRAVNRAAVFMFFIGDRYFGTITAFVPGQAADQYEFTSSLPVQILKSLAPVLRPLVRDAQQPLLADNQHTGNPSPAPEHTPLAGSGRPTTLPGTAHNKPAIVSFSGQLPKS